MAYTKRIEIRIKMTKESYSLAGSICRLICERRADGYVVATKRNAIAILVARVRCVAGHDKLFDIAIGQVLDKRLTSVIICAGTTKNGSCATDGDTIATLPASISSL